MNKNKFNKPVNVTEVSTPAPAAPHPPRISMGKLKALQKQAPIISGTGAPATASTPFTQQAKLPTSSTPTAKLAPHPISSISNVKVREARVDQDGKTITDSNKPKLAQTNALLSPTKSQFHPSLPVFDPPPFSHLTNLPVLFDKFLNLDKSITLSQKMLHYPVLALNPIDAQRMGVMIGDLICISAVVDNDADSTVATQNQPNAQNLSFPTHSTPVKTKHQAKFTTTSPFTSQTPPTPLHGSTPQKAPSHTAPKNGSHHHLAICRVYTFNMIPVGKIRLDTQFKSILPLSPLFLQFSTRSAHNLSAGNELLLFLNEHYWYITSLNNVPQYPLQNIKRDHYFPIPIILPVKSLCFAKNDTCLSDNEELAYIVSLQQQKMGEKHDRSQLSQNIPNNDADIIPQISQALDTAVMASLVPNLSYHTTTITSRPTNNSTTLFLPSVPLCASVCGAQRPYYPYHILPFDSDLITVQNNPKYLLIYSTTPSTKITLTMTKRHSPDVSTTTSLPPPSLSLPLQAPQAQQEEVIIAGLDNEITILKETLELPLKQPKLFSTFGLKPPKGVLLHGPPGCGKTLLALWFSKQTSAQFISLTATTILSRGGAGYLYSLFSSLSAPVGGKKPPIILFIDEIDGLCGDTTIICALLSLLDGGHDGYGNICILGATNRPNALPTALRRPGRFDVEVNVTPPSVQARGEILRKKLGPAVSEGTGAVRHRLTPHDITTVAERCNGFVGADIDLLISEAISHSILRSYSFNFEEKDVVNVKMDQDLFNPSVLLEDFNYALHIIKPSALRDSTMVSVSDAEVGGHVEIKQRLEEAFEWPLRHAGLVQALGARKSSGILLFGPPGCAKTLLAKSVCARSKRTFLSVKGPELFSKYVGDSEKAVRSVFQRARACAPCILFLDEIDSFGAARGGSGGDATDRVVSQLLVEMDGIGDRGDICILAATNRPDLVDRALLRAGRLDRSLFVGPPDFKETQDILRIGFNGMSCHPDVATALPEFAEMCYAKRHTGAELAAICRDASVRALTRFILYQEQRVSGIYSELDDLTPERLFVEHNNEGDNKNYESMLEKHDNTNEVCVTYQDVLDAINEAKPRITDKMVQFYLDYQQQHGLTNL